MKMPTVRTEVLALCCVYISLHLAQAFTDQEKAQAVKVLNNLSQSRQGLSTLQAMIDSIDSTLKDKQKRTCAFNLGGHCATENAASFARQWNYLNSNMSPGRRRRSAENKELVPASQSEDSVLLRKLTESLQNWHLQWFTWRHNAHQGHKLWRYNMHYDVTTHTVMGWCHSHSMTSQSLHDVTHYPWRHTPSTLKKSIEKKSYRLSLWLSDRSANQFVSEY